MYVLKLLTGKALKQLPLKLKETSLSYVLTLTITNLAYTDNKQAKPRTYQLKATNTNKKAVAFGRREAKNSK